MGTKIIRIITAMAIAILLGSCSNDGQKLTAEGVEGTSADVISIADEDANLAMSGDKDMGQILIIKVKLKLEKSLPGIKELDAEDINLGDGPSLSVMDKNGAELAKLELGNGSLDSDNTAEFKKFLQSDEGTEKEISFALQLLDMDMAKKIIDKARTFKIKNLNIETTGITTLSGNIGNYPVQMTLDIETDGSIKGAYYYKKNGSTALLYVTGTKNGDDISLNEFTQEGQQTGSFQGTLADNKLSGVFETDGKTFSVSLKADGNIQPINLSNINFDGFSEIPTMDTAEPVQNSSSIDDLESLDLSSGDVSFDEALDAFEEYTDQYIALIKRASRGDATAIAEYPDLFHKLEVVSNKFERAQGEMSAAQWERYLQINSKMVNGLQKYYH